MEELKHFPSKAISCLHINANNLHLLTNEAIVGSLTELYIRCDNPKLFPIVVDLTHVPDTCNIVITTPTMDMTIIDAYKVDTLFIYGRTNIDRIYETFRSSSKPLKLKSLLYYYFDQPSLLHDLIDLTNPGLSIEVVLMKNKKCNVIPGVVQYFKGVVSHMPSI